MVGERWRMDLLLVDLVIGEGGCSTKVAGSSPGLGSGSGSEWLELANLQGVVDDV